METYRNYLLLAFLAMTVSSRFLLTADVDNDQKVLVEVYLESLCPYCQDFVVEQLAQIAQNPELLDIADFRIYPFGNGKVDKWGRRVKFTCQHESEECFGNMIMNCALDHYNFQKQALPYIICLEKSGKNWQDDGKSCARETGIDWNIVQRCANSFEGQERMFEVALTTQYANINGVPSVKINGQHNANSVVDLVHQICSQYKGKQVTSICAGHNSS